LPGADLPFGIDREYGMNQRILELMTKAGFDVEKLRIYPGGFPREDLLVLEDFAKLVAKECVDICNRIYFERYPDAEDWEQSEEGDAIKQYFGVEE
jgi:hypothetical protein